MTSRLLHRQRTLNRLAWYEERLKEARQREIDAISDKLKWLHAIQMIQGDLEIDKGLNDSLT